MRRLLDNTEGLSRLYLPGSLAYALRPKGWGKSTLLQDLAILYRSDPAETSQTFSKECWIRKNKNLLFRQPKMVPLILRLSSSATSHETVEAQMLRQLIPSSTLPDDVGKFQSMLQHDDVCGAIEMASKMHGGKRVALLVDDFDEVFVATSGSASESMALKKQHEEQRRATCSLLMQLCRSLEEKRGAGTVLMKGTFRPKELRTMLEKMRDLSMDLNHNSTWGMSLRESADKEAAKAASQVLDRTRKGYSWSENEGRPILRSMEEEKEVEVEVENEMEKEIKGTVVPRERYAGEGVRVPFNAAGGYWFGGRWEEDGETEAVSSLRPWKPFSHRDPMMNLLFGSETEEQEDEQEVEEEKGEITEKTRQRLAHGIKTLVEGAYDMTELSKYSQGYVDGSFDDGDDDGDNSDHHHHDSNHYPRHYCNDWPAVLLQAGVLTMASRSMRFDEFHTYAWLRLTFPNEAMRGVFIQDVLCPTLALLAGSESETIKEKEILHCLHRLSISLRTSSKEDLTPMLETLSQCARALSVSLSSSSLESSLSIEECLKFLLLGVRDLWLDDKIGDERAQTEGVTDTFSDSKGFMELIQPNIKEWNMRCQASDGRRAPPARFGGGGGGEGSGSGSGSRELALYDQKEQLRGVLKLPKYV